MVQKEARLGPSSEGKRPRGRPRSYDPERALERALETFWTFGYSRTSLDDLSTAMGMNRPSLYGAFGVPVADVAAGFQVHDTTLVDGTPLNVVRECQWTWICAPPPHGADIQANSDGYGVIAEAFEQQL